MALVETCNKEVLRVVISNDLYMSSPLSTASSSGMSKNALRRQMRLLLSSMELSEKVRQSQSITSKLLNFDKYLTSTSVALYLSMEDEVCTNDIVKHVLSDGSKRVYIPQYRTKPSLQMEMVRLYSWEDYLSLPLTSWGIRQPSLDDEQRERLERPDLIVVPGLAFSSDGERLGRGKGFYDKYISKIRKESVDVSIVALAFTQQIVQHVPVDEGDQRVHLIFTAD